MNTINKYVLDLTVSIIDFLYKGRDFQRFWVLEEIARAPYFAFLSVLHLRESLGLRGSEHVYLMKEHFAQTLNETEHLEYMESRGGNSIGLIASSPDISYLSIIGSMWFIIGILALVYHLSYEIEIHAAETYAEYLTRFPDDKKICEIMNDEVQYSRNCGSNEID